ncbi:MAG: hypothetical protein Fur0042_27630 [Cyanophyceae cyanobacterium]
MANALSRLEQELAKVRERAAVLAQQLYGADVAYFKALAAAARQQLVLAGYHVCTQKYPKAFLKLSLAQRQQLQQELRHLGQQLEWQMLTNLVAPTTELEDQLRSLLQSLGPGDGPPPPPSSDGPQGDREATPEPPPEPTEPEMGADMERDPGAMADRPEPAAPLTGAPDLSPEEVPPALMAQSGNPIQILGWQRSLEKAALASLHSFSQRANQRLRAAGILPRKLPLALLEMADKNDLDLGAEVAASSPNLLDLLLDSDEGEGRDRPPQRLTAIHLRLAEIELADASVMARRPPLQQTVDALSSLCAQYEKLRQQYAIAQAEAAWRSSWFED